MQGNRVALQQPQRIRRGETETEIRVAADAVDLEAIHRLRYHVFCEELGFMAPEQYPYECEVDEHDPSSLHLGAFGPDGQPVACLRLVLERPFPLETHCRTFPHVDLGSFRAAEASRMCAAPELRRPGEEKRRQAILVRLYHELLRCCRKRGIEYWLGAIEDPFVQRLNAMGYGCEPIGPEVDYHGPVTPYRASVARGLAVHGEMLQ
jgi:N-acyl-L-homoserine lactone synthetase